MKKVLAIVLVLAATLPALAKPKKIDGNINTTTDRNSTCPLVILYFGGTATTPNLRVGVINHSGMGIAVVTFGVETMNSDGNYQALAQTVSINTRITTYGGATTTWNLPEYDKDGPPAGDRLHIIKVVFTDGTAWNDEDTGRCFASYDHRKM